MRAIILLFERNSYIEIPADGVRVMLPEGTEDITKGSVVLYNKNNISGIFKLSEITGFFMAEAEEK